MFYSNRVKDTTTTTGTGNITLSGTAPTGYENFNTRVGTKTSFKYVIAGQGTSEYEVGIGYLSASTTLVRDQVEQSSNSDALVSFSTGTKDVWLDFSANQAILAQNQNLIARAQGWL